MKLLLIYPPFITLSSLHLAIPLLTSYLRSKGINVSVWDANIDFWNVMLEPDRIKYGRKYIADRLLELNGKKPLSLDESNEYIYIQSVIKSFEDIHKERYKSLISGEKNRTPEQYLFIKNDLKIALQLSSAPHYPERFIHTYTSLTYKSLFSPYSTSDIINSLNRNSVFRDFYVDYVKKVIEQKKPQIIGFSVTFEDQVLSAFQCASIIKIIAPEIHITFGGAWISATMHKLTNKLIFNYVDSFLLGDGENPLESLTYELLKEKPDLSNVPGIIYKKNNEIIKMSQLTPLDIRTLPLPDYSAFPLDDYPLPKEMLWINLRTSRGCNWRKCIFCPNHNDKLCDHQQADSDYVFNCLRHVKEQTEMFLFSFVEETSDPVILEKLGERIINSGKLFLWCTNVRLDKRITLDRCMLFKNSGCCHLSFGIETYNDRLLNYIGKGLNTKTINYAISNIAWAGISSLAYMIVGLPTETEHEAINSHRSILDLNQQKLLTYYKYSPLMLLPGSDIYDNPEKYGIKLLPINNKYDLPFPETNFKGTPISPENANKLALKFTDSYFNPYFNK